MSHKLYVTGGVGSRHLGEAFGQPYELPNDLAYDETCAAIASILWSWRMLLATGQSRFADLIDRTLHNAVLSGVSLDGERYFYVNPLHSAPRPMRARTGTSSRAARRTSCGSSRRSVITSRPGATGLQVHQYATSTIRASCRSQAPSSSRSRRLPVGSVTVEVVACGDAEWTLSLRVPAWARRRVDGSG